MMINVTTGSSTTHAPGGGGTRLDRGQFVRPIAHRGLHNLARGIIENTEPAFVAAIEQDYGIECDLQPASDGTPMVFHDATLDRLIAGTGRIAAKTPSELSVLRYKERDTRILTFGELLHLIGGRVPLLAEIKSGGRAPRRFLAKVAAEASAYLGPIALMSFDRQVMMQLTRMAPQLPLGLVVGTHQLAANWWAGPTAAGQNAAVSAVLNNVPAGISFLAVEVRMLEAAKAWIDHNAPNLPLFTWTVRTATDRAAAARWADAPIFEETETGDAAANS